MSSVSFFILKYIADTAGNNRILPLTAGCLNIHAIKNAIPKITKLLSYLPLNQKYN
jgi:hypothetical protein